MKSKTSSCTTTYLLLIVFCTLFVYIVVRKMHNVQLQEGLKMKSLNKLGGKLGKTLNKYAEEILDEVKSIGMGLLIISISVTLIGIVFFLITLAIYGAASKMTDEDE